MPSPNRIKIYAADSFYHIYNRGVEKRKIFLDDEDYRTFLNLFKRHLGSEPVLDLRKREYENYYQKIELLAYCLMPNHFHLLVYQTEPHIMTEFLRRVCTAYVGYFNKKYDRVGGLFQSCYKASLIYNEAYLWHISRYIHLNPSHTYQNYPYSSYKYYIGKPPSWIRPQRILEMHLEDKEPYEKFVSDFDGYKKSLDQVQSELA